MAITSESTPLEMFKLLYKRKGPVDIIAVQTKISSMRYGVKKPMEDHIAEFERYCALMQSADEPIPFNLKVASGC